MATIVYPRWGEPVRPAKELDKAGKPTAAYAEKPTEFRWRNSMYSGNISGPVKALQEMIRRISGATLFAVEDGSDAHRAATGPQIYGAYRVR